MRATFLLAVAVAISVVTFGLDDPASARTTYRRSKALRSWTQELSRQKKVQEEQRHYQASQKHSSYKGPTRRRRHRY